MAARKWTRDQMLKAVEAVKGGKMKATPAARKYGVPASTLRHYLDPDHDKKGRSIPLSEEAGEYHETWTAEDCIKALRDLAHAHPSKFMTRMFFRNQEICSEATWTRYFGTFHEFKNQAHITRSRHTKKLERDVAKHASADSYRAMNLDKAGWEGKYLKPKGDRFQTILVGSDIHDIHCDPFWLRLWLETAERVQPEKTVINGDLFDLAEFGKFANDPREWDAVGRIEWVHDFLACTRNQAPETEITLIEGNHEFRLFRHLAETTPVMKAVLADLHGFTIASLLKLDEYEVNLVSRCDLAAFTEADVKKELTRNWMVFYDTCIGHHFPTGRQMGLPGWHGHHHKHIVWPGYSPVYGSFEWHQLGAGHMRKASYCDGEKWQNGFLLAHVDTLKKFVQFEYIDTTHDHAVIGGRWYERTAEEKI
jgi:hypothetical protein